MKAVVQALIGLGVAFHVLAFLSDGELDGMMAEAAIFLAWLILPYLVCLAILRWTRKPVLVCPAVLLMLAIDILGYIEFQTSDSSTAALGLLVWPAINIVIAIPLGLLIGWLIQRARNTRTGGVA